MDDTAGMIAALGHLIRIDPSFATASDRLRRALLDLAPHEERSGRLVATGAELGVPGLLAGGHATEARHRLADEAGMRGEVVDWVVGVWSAALHTADTAHEPPPGRHTPAPPEEPAAGERPGVPSAIRVATWPDGAPLVAVLTSEGIFVATGTPGDGAGWGGWRRVASPTAPASRDVALATRPGDTDEAVVVWSESAGVRHRRVRRDAVNRLALGPPQTLAASPDGAEPRHPVVATASAGGALDVVWTVDRVTLRHTVSQPGRPGRPARRLPDPCPANDHLRSLDVAAQGSRAAWLAALTARGAVRLAEWNLGLDDVTPWVTVATPRPLAALAVAAPGLSPLLVGVTVDGDLLTVAPEPALNRGAPWTGLSPDGETPAIGRVLALTATGATGGGGGRGHLAVAGTTGSWIATLSHGSAGPALTPPVALRL